MARRNFSSGLTRGKHFPAILWRAYVNGRWILWRAYVNGRWLYPWPRDQGYDAAWGQQARGCRPCANRISPLTFVSGNGTGWGLCHGLTHHRMDQIIPTFEKSTLQHSFNRINALKKLHKNNCINIFWKTTFRGPSRARVWQLNACSYSWHSSKWTEYQIYKMQSLPKPLALQWSPLVRSAFCPKKIDHTSGLTL